MARDKEFEARMQGMIYAYNLVKEGGIEALNNDLKKRNFLKAPFNVSVKEMEAYYHNISENVYHNMITAVCYTLHDVFGFGKKRITDFMMAFNKNVMHTRDFDYMGEHYVKMEDYAIELNEKFKLGIDVERVAACAELTDQADENYRMCKIDDVLRELKRCGFEDAAVFLEKKLD